MKYPTFPTNSLYGNFPNFPANYIDIPNMIDLPGYLRNVIGYYTDVLNAPYGNPPALNTWSIPYPNLLGIPTWIEKIGYYIAGWGGAILRYVLKYTVALLVNGVSFILNLGMGSLSSIMTTITTEGAKLGILGIPFEITASGLLVVAVVLIATGIIKGIQAIGDMA